MSMDGLNVNLKVYKEFSRLYKEKSSTCSLDDVHNSFRTGVEATGSNAKKVLKGSFHILHNNPARRENYESQTGSATYSFKCCVTR